MFKKDLSRRATRASEQGAFAMRSAAKMIKAAVFVGGSFWTVATVEAQDDAAGPDEPTQTSEQQAPEMKPGTEETWSPLHLYLGIDPATGEFKSPQDRRPVQEQTAADGNGNAAEELPAEATRDHAAEGDAPAEAEPEDENPLRDLLNQPDGQPPSQEQITDAVSDALRNLDQESVERAARALPGLYGQEEFFSRLRRISLIFTPLFLIYPIYIIAGELIAVWWRRSDQEVNELDARYFRSRVRNRILMAVLIAAAIGVMAAFEPLEVWRNPTWLTAAAIVLLVLGFAIAGLSLAVKQSARRHDREVVRELRRHQQELRQEVVELQKRIRSFQLTAGR